MSLLGVVNPVDEIDFVAGTGDGSVKPAIEIHRLHRLGQDAAHVDEHVAPLAALGLVALRI